MRLITSISKNIISTLSVNIFSKILSILVNIYVIRYFTKLDYGMYASASAIIYLFLSLNQFGLKQSCVREIAQNKKKASEILVNSLYIRLIVIIILSCTALFYLFFNSYNISVIKLALLILGINFFDSIKDQFSIIFFGFEKLEWNAIFQFIFGIINFSTVFTAIYFFNINIFQYAVINILLSILPFVFHIVVLKRRFEIQFNLKINITQIKYIFNESVPFALSGIGWILFEYTDKTMLSKIMGSISVGEYAVGKHVLKMAGLIYIIYFSSIYPVLSRLYKISSEKFTIIINKSFQYLATVTFPLALIMYLGANYFLTLLFGQKYAASIIIIEILSLNFINRMFYRTFVIWMNTTGKQKIVTYIVSIGAIVNAIFNYILIKKLGIAGAAWGTVIAITIMNILFIIYVIKNIPDYSIFNVIKYTYKPFISLIIAILSYFGLSFFLYNKLVLSIITTIIYVLFIILLKTFGSFEKKLIKIFIDDIKGIKD